jgi:glutamate racemase
VESGWTANRVAELTAREYLAPLKKKGIDTLVLGCTHYPMLKSVVRKVMGPSVRLVDSAEEVSSDVKAYLTLRGLLNRRKGRGRVLCWLSDMSPYSIKAAGFILREKNIRISLKKF